MTPSNVSLEAYDQFSKIKEICFGTLIIVVLESLKGNENLINTIIPVLYWISYINTTDFSINLQFVFLIIGVFLTALQLHYLNTFERLIGKKTRSDQIIYLKQRKAPVVFSIIFWIYGITTFYFMCAGPKNTVVWALIAFYMIGVLIFLFSVWEERDHLLEYGKLILKK